jgi:hypothetical protein
MLAVISFSHYRIFQRMLCGERIKHPIQSWHGTAFASREHNRYSDLFIYTAIQPQ